MERKTLFALSLGVLAAAVICLITGVLLFVFAGNDAVKLLVGLAMMGLGAFMAVIPLIISVWLLVVKLTDKKKDDNQ